MVVMVALERPVRKVNGACPECRGTEVSRVTKVCPVDLEPQVNKGRKVNLEPQVNKGRKVNVGRQVNEGRKVNVGHKVTPGRKVILVVTVKTLRLRKAGD